MSNKIHMQRGKELNMISEEVRNENIEVRKTKKKLRLGLQVMGQAGEVTVLHKTLQVKEGTDNGYMSSFGRNVFFEIFAEKGEKGKPDCM